MSHGPYLIGAAWNLEKIFAEQFFWPLCVKYFTKNKSTQWAVLCQSSSWVNSVQNCSAGAWHISKQPEFKYQPLWKGFPKKKKKWQQKKKKSKACSSWSSWWPLLLVRGQLPNQHAAPLHTPVFDNSNYIPGNRGKVINTLLWFYYFNAAFSFCSNSMVTCCGLLDLVKLNKIHSL